MKKLFILLVVMFSFGSLKAQTTSVSMTVVDPSTQVWANGFITYTFSPTPGYPGPYQWQGANLPSIYLTPQIATLNGSGVTTISIPDNTTITPAKSSWAFVVCSNTSFQCASVKIPVSGASQDISAAINAALVAINLPATTFPRAYTNSEITLNPQLGGLFYDTTLSCLKFWNGSAWTCLSTSSGATVTLQTNSANNSSQTLLNLESTSSVTVTNTSGGIDTFAINPSLLGTFCLSSGVNCPASSGTTTVNTVPCALNGSCTIPSSGTTTIGGTACALNGSCVPSTTVNSQTCALGGSCTIPTGISTSRTCNGNGCYLILSDGTIFEFGTTTVTPTTTAQGTATINFPYTFPTTYSLTTVGETVSGCVTGDSLVPFVVGFVSTTLTGVNLNVSKFAVPGGGGGNFNSSPACIVQWTAIGY